MIATPSDFLKEARTVILFGGPRNLGPRESAWRCGLRLRIWRSSVVAMGRCGARGLLAKRWLICQRIIGFRLGRLRDVSALLLKLLKLLKLLSYVMRYP